jgi:C4-dicarboxylate-specific signal transduction histidine kinase
VIDTWHEAAVERARNADGFDPIAQSEHEQELQEWMEEQGISEPWRLAPSLVGCGLDREQLAELSQSLTDAQIPSDVFECVLCRFVAATALDGLLTQVQESCRRVSELVDTVKAYTFMDQAPIQQVDLHLGLDSTLTMLNYRLGRIEVCRDFDPELQGRGRLTLRTACEGGNVLVEIIDSGTGIPPDIQDRVFEPFFTTKDVGSGTGLGLDVSRRIVVGHHRGDIRFVTRPGETRFQVRLPLTPPHT